MSARLFGGRRWLVERDQTASDEGECHSHVEQGIDLGEINFMSGEPDGEQAVDDRRAGKDDGHDFGGLAFGAECEEDAKSADGAGNARDEGPPGTTRGISGECGAFGEEEKKGGEDRRQKVGDADEEERLVAAVDGIAHEDLAFVKEDAVNAPREDRQQGEHEPGVSWRGGSRTHGR